MRDFIKQWRESMQVDKIMEPVTQLAKMIKMVESFRSLLTDNSVSEIIKRRIDGLMMLVTNKPSIAGINHYFNHFLLQLEPENQIPIFKELLEVYQERWKNIDRKTAEAIFNWLNFNDEPTILCHDNDPSLIALLELLNVKQKNIKVYVTVGRPTKQGMNLAKLIAEKGFDVTFVEDNCIAQIITEIDFVLLVAHQVMHNEFIAQAGSHTIAATANFYKRPVYVIADRRKILNAKYFPQKVLDSIIGEMNAPKSSIWEKAPKDIQVVATQREFVPNYLAERFFLEIGTYKPEELKEEIDRTMVTRFF